MSVFNQYAAYYDELYRDKDYQAEVDYADDMIRDHAPQSRSILDLGCGTGNHAFLFADKNYCVTGVDLSDRNIEIAKHKQRSFGNKYKDLVFIAGDVRNVRMQQNYDVVLSLFHVLSYQVSGSDLQATFETAACHLNKGGLFLFDCWYGPAVISEKPVTRIKRIHSDNYEIIRLAEPIAYPNENLVDVNYSLIVKNNSNNSVEEFSELHRMRYLFKPEIEAFARCHGFRTLEFLEWMTDKTPDFHSWNVCFLMRRM